VVLQPLNSPGTATEVAFGAHTGRSRPCQRIRVGIAPIPGGMIAPLRPGPQPAQQQDCPAWNTSTAELVADGHQ